MNFDNFNKYTLFLDELNGVIKLVRKEQNGKPCNFKTPVTQKQCPKIYVLKQKESIVYVGYASQSIGARLWQGINARKYSYKWRNVKEIELLVFVSNVTLIGNKCKKDKAIIAFAEAVEAELVLKVRQETGKWPKFQNEIHFNNVLLEKASEIALQIYTKIMK